MRTTRPALPVWTVLLLLTLCLARAHSQTTQQVVDIPTRPGVTQRLLVLTPPAPRATVVLFTGGNGGLQLYPNGSMQRGEGNFLVRSRQSFAGEGLRTVVIDAPSDRQTPPFLAGYRQRPEHVADVRAVIAWAREQGPEPVWLVGTSRGTQSVAYVATELRGAAGPDGIVLTSTILRDDQGRPVSAMPLETLRIPVLVVHHEQDGCRACPFGDTALLMAKLADAPRKELIAVSGGENRGDPCEAFAYHGFNGLERTLVTRIADWLLSK